MYYTFIKLLDGTSWSIGEVGTFSGVDAEVKNIVKCHDESGWSFEVQYDNEVVFEIPVSSVLYAKQIVYR